MASGDHAVVRDLLARERISIRRAFKAFLARVRSPAVSSRIAQIARDGSIARALGILDKPLRNFANELPLAFIRAARFEMHRHRVAKASDDELIAEISGLFEVGDTKAARIMNQSRLEFIADFNQKQRRSVSAALAASLRRGEGPRQAARSIRDSIGLTQTQWEAVDNYRTMLESGSMEALSRQLRDRRFDNRVTNAITRGDILADDQIDRMVERYTDGMLAFRADTIAITESHRAVARGRRAALEKIVDETGTDDSSVIRTWNTTMDGRERDTHHAMNGQTVVGLDEPFVSPSGAELMHPHDPTAPPEETIRCRCVETYDFAPDAGELGA